MKVNHEQIMELCPCQLCLECDTAIVYSKYTTRYHIEDDTLFEVDHQGLNFQKKRMKPSAVFDRDRSIYHNHETPKYNSVGLFIDMPKRAYECTYILQYKEGIPISAQSTHGAHQCGDLLHWIPWEKFCKCVKPDIYRLINTVVPCKQVDDQGRRTFYLKRGPVIDNAHTNWEQYTPKKKIYVGLL
jgi:hypothetical protein